MISVEAVLLGLDRPMRPDDAIIMVSASEKQAKELMVKVVRWARMFDDYARKLTGMSIFSAEPSTERIQFWNGNRIISLSSNPNTLAGYHGHVFWDEAAKTPHDELVYEAIHPITSSDENYVMRITSTPWGDTGKFFEVCQGRMPGWSRHEINIVDAVKQGAPHDLKTLRGQYDSLTWDQNYMCRFVSNMTSVFSSDLLRSAMDHYAELDKPSYEQFKRGQVRVALGMDIGRVHDRSSIVWCIEYPEGRFRIPKTKQLAKARFIDQEKYVTTLLQSGEVHKLWIDASGIGRQMAENLQIAFPHIVQPVYFTAERKGELVTTMQAQLERGVLALCPDNDLISDLSSIRSTYLNISKIIRYDSPRTATGHSDSAWAAMLAVNALAHVKEWRMNFLDENTIDITNYGRNTPSGPVVLATPGVTSTRAPTIADLGLNDMTIEEIEEIKQDFGDDPAMVEALINWQ